jgi:hypothetical protein
MWCLLLGYAPDNGMMDPLPQWDGIFFDFPSRWNISTAWCL